jgi:hypothetical protein
MFPQRFPPNGIKLTVVIEADQRLKRAVVHTSIQITDIKSSTPPPVYRGDAADDLCGQCLHSARNCLPPLLTSPAKKGEDVFQIIMRNHRPIIAGGHLFDPRRWRIYPYPVSFRPSSARARNSLDSTVPRGTPSVTAIS